MPALFRPWANTATRVALFALPLGAAMALASPMIYARSPWATGAHDPVLQPIAFDHRHHVQDDGIACLYCHEGAERSAYAGVPPTERCMGCHAQVWNDSAAIAPLLASAVSRKPIRWQRVHSLPDFVYFDHAVHTAKRVGCVECHGDVGSMAAVYQVAPLTMNWCLDCHRRRAPALVHCSTCHR